VVMALLNSIFLEIKLRETRSLVIVVPILAPITMGMASGMFMDPLATIATITDVVVELLCTIDVMSKPMNNPTKGLEVTEIIDLMVSLPR